MDNEYLDLSPIPNSQHLIPHMGVRAASERTNQNVLELIGTTINTPRS
ncbi:MAG: hypothetical protein AAFQ14_11700 [Cyanobacteria bacterium J06621_12]